MTRALPCIFGCGAAAVGSDNLRLGAWCDFLWKHAEVCSGISHGNTVLERLARGELDRAIWRRALRAVALAFRLYQAVKAQGSVGGGAVCASEMSGGAAGRGSRHLESPREGHL